MNEPAPRRAAPAAVEARGSAREQSVEARGSAREPNQSSEPRSFRVMLGLGGAIYLAWWFAVEALLPGAFNPLPGLLVVVGYFLSMFALTHVSDAFKRRAEQLFYFGALALVAHYFYLFHHNARDINWAVGAYVVVFALCVGVQSRVWLYLFAGFSFACGLAVFVLDPALQKTIFLPGLATILILCLAMLLNRLRLLARLAESTTRFQNLFDATFEGVAVQDRGEIVDVNAAFSELFGYTREELIGRSVIDLNAPEHRAHVAARIKDVPTGRYESVGLRKDGSRFTIEISTKPHVFQGRALRLAAVRDISDRLRLEEERVNVIQEQTARASAQEAVRLRDEFISIASHELRTPITSLLLQHDAFVSKWQGVQRPEDVATYTARVRRQLNRLRRLVEELLDVSRLGAGRLTLKKEQVALESVVKDVLETLAEDLERAECPLDFRVASAVSGHWDRLRLEQVLENLLRNAITFGPGKPIEIRVDADSEGQARLSVRDYGMGIDKVMQEKVFQRFERGVSTSHYGGLGLGLYIARQIIEAHHGTLSVESEPGQGSTFRIALPTKAPSSRALRELNTH
jgi:PAS domain S-box-containing protein